jgi:hypothetical protein
MSLLLTSPLAQADSPYWIPTFGANWPTLQVSVNVPSQPTYLHDLVLQTIQIWNQAQEWLKESYYPTGDIYTLVASNTGIVTIQLTSLVNLQKLCNNASPELEGCTLLRWDQSNYVYQATIYFTANVVYGHPLFLGLHEFGHVLGLPDYPEPCPFHDLMCFSNGVYPSTLDLYAIHVLASGGQSKKVWLPTNIPYTTWSRGATPIPEFPITAFPIIITSLMLVAVIVRRFERPNNGINRLVTNQA